MKYRIISEAGVDMGIFEALTAIEAVRAMNRDAGYPTDEAVLSVTRQKNIMEGLTVEEAHTLNRSKGGAILTGDEETLTGSIEDCIQDYRHHHEWAGAIDVDGVEYQDEEATA